MENIDTVKGRSGKFKIKATYEGKDVTDKVWITGDSELGPITIARNQTWNGSFDWYAERNGSVTSSVIFAMDGNDSNVEGVGISTKHFPIASVNPVLTLTSAPIPTSYQIKENDFPTFTYPFTVSDQKGPLELSDWYLTEYCEFKVIDDPDGYLQIDYDDNKISIVLIGGPDGRGVVSTTPQFSPTIVMTWWGAEIRMLITVSPAS